MSADSQLSLPPALLKRVANSEAPSLNRVENDEIARDLTLDEAKALAGHVVSEVINASGEAGKAFGDKGAVSRWRSGTENPNFAKLIQTVDQRKTMAKVLLRSCGERVKERTVFEIEETA